jgi:hypothetical protein
MVIKWVRAFSKAFLSLDARNFIILRMREGGRNYDINSRNFKKKIKDEFHGACGTGLLCQNGVDGSDSA